MVGRWAATHRHGFGRNRVDPWLDHIDRDIAAGRNIGDLPQGLLAEMRRAVIEVSVDLDEDMSTAAS